MLCPLSLFLFRNVASYTGTGMYSAVIIRGLQCGSSPHGFYCNEGLYYYYYYYYPKFQYREDHISHAVTVDVLVVFNYHCTFCDCKYGRSVKGDFPVRDIYMLKVFRKLDENPMYVFVCASGNQPTAK